MRLCASRSKAMKVSARLTILALSASLAACVGPIARPSLSPSKPKGDALLVLPGLGYGRGGEEALRSLAPRIASDGVDLYVPTYVTRSGLAASRAKLERFVRDNRLDQYERVHVFAFLAGAWTLNPLVEQRQWPNLASVIYDRSPFQERAPRIAADKLRFLAWVRYGTTVFDVARTPYVPLHAPDVKVALMVESIGHSLHQAIREDGARVRTVPLRLRQLPSEVRRLCVSPDEP